MGEVREKTLRELAEPDEDQRPLYIVIPPTPQPFELKLGLIHLLPIFKKEVLQRTHTNILRIFIWNTVDAAAGGTLANKTLATEARELISRITKLWE
ncbi:Copia protein [Cucumis melo var. makuwa]|uniref:Copia protein n=1 Tax=Cucumis melo var. makuwa TaxID=1194695 RepID=A0A5D3CJQ8_CUCMM|nr:Copia protein [Cucumis melo var. makuwa]TYK12133.1 Copia protein [Cucumis melo var. makuwa]